MKIQLVGLLSIASCLFSVPGCTHIELKVSTLDAGSTLTDMEYRQVLDNIAMFEATKDPSTNTAGAMPWFLKINSGQVQVSDGVTPSYQYVWPVSAANTAGGNVSHNLTEFWGVVPVTLNTTLQNMQKRYSDLVTGPAENKWYTMDKAPPINAVCVGHYHEHIIWVSRANLLILTSFTEDMLKEAATAQPGEKSLLIQGTALVPK